jgi:hypothetical protein
MTAICRIRTVDNRNPFAYRSSSAAAHRFICSPLDTPETASGGVILLTKNGLDS